jgi:hypothetical protein
MQSIHGYFCRLFGAHTVQVHAFAQSCILGNTHKAGRILWLAGHDPAHQFDRALAHAVAPLLAASIHGQGFVPCSGAIGRTWAGGAQLTLATLHSQYNTPCQDFAGESTRHVRAWLDGLPSTLSHLYRYDNGKEDWEKRTVIAANVLVMANSLPPEDIAEHCLIVSNTSTAGEALPFSPAETGELIRRWALFSPQYQEPPQWTDHAECH